MVIWVWEWLHLSELYYYYFWNCIYITPSTQAGARRKGGDDVYNFLVQFLAYSRHSNKTVPFLFLPTSLFSLCFNFKLINNLKNVMACAKTEASGIARKSSHWDLRGHRKSESFDHHSFIGSGCISSSSSAILTAFVWLEESESNVHLNQQSSMETNMCIWSPFLNG